MIIIVRLNRNIPCVNHPISTPFDTSHGECVTTQTDDTFLQYGVPYSSIAILACTYKPSTWRIQMNWFPGNTRNKGLVALQPTIHIRNITFSLPRANNKSTEKKKGLRVYSKWVSQCFSGLWIPTLKFSSLTSANNIRAVR